METTNVQAAPELAGDEVAKLAKKAAAAAVRAEIAEKLRVESEAATAVDVAAAVSALAAAHHEHAKVVARLAAAVDCGGAAGAKSHTAKLAATYRQSVKAAAALGKNSIRTGRAIEWYTVCGDNSQYKNFVEKLAPALDKLCSALCKFANTNGLVGRKELAAASAKIDFDGLRVSIEPLTETLVWVQRPGQKETWECSFVVTTSAGSVTLKNIPVKAAAVRGAVKSILSGKQ